MVDSEAVDKVRQMQAAGYTNSQIIQIMQNDGFSSAQIFDALNQANTIQKSPLSPPPPPPPEKNDDLPPIPPLPELPKLDNDTQPAQPLNNNPPQSTIPQVNIPQPSINPPPITSPQANTPPIPELKKEVRNSGVGHDFDKVSAEEYIEQIIEEKWQELEDDIQKVVEWKNKSEQKIIQLDQSFQELKERFEKLHAALIGKIESYDKNIIEVGAEIKAMEKVFSKVLPVFTENVKQLSDITERMDKKIK